MCVSVCGVLVGGGPSAGSFTDVATIRRRGRLTSARTPWPSVGSDLAPDDGSAEEKAKKLTDILN